MKGFSNLNVGLTKQVEHLEKTYLYAFQNWFVGVLVQAPGAKLNKINERRVFADLRDMWMIFGETLPLQNPTENQEKAEKSQETPLKNKDTTKDKVE